MNNLIVPDKSWTLFLDRDGVINIRKPDEYVLSPDEFIFIEGAKESIAKLSDIFGPVVVVTNQQGIGKNLMTEKDLEHIHEKMLTEIQKSGGRIDKVYHCAALKEEGSFFRKPYPGMALKAGKEIPAINFKKSVMVGDTLSDMRFGKNLKMKTVLISNNKKDISAGQSIIDLAFPSLKDFAEYIIV